MKRRKNGEGSFEHLPDGRVRMRKQHGNLPNGRPQILTVTGKSETDCLKMMKKKEAEYENCYNKEKIAKTMTLAELCYAHLDFHVGETNRLKPKSRDRREGTIRNQIEKYPIGRMQAFSLTGDEIYNHIVMLINLGTLSISSVEKTYNIINSAYKWAVAKKYYKENPCLEMADEIKDIFKKLETKNSSDGFVTILSDDQIESLKQYSENLGDKCWHQRMMPLSSVVLLEAGLREGEFCALRRRDCYSSGEKYLIDINKTRNIIENRDKKDEDTSFVANENEVKNWHNRTIILNHDATVALSEMLRISPLTDPDDYVLLNRRKKPSNPSNFDKNIKTLYRRIGFPDEISGAHILRRTCATQMYDNGCSIEDIAAYLGDTPETILKHYISLTKKIVVGNSIKNAVNYPTKK